MRIAKYLLLLTLLLLLALPFAAADGHLPDLGGRAVTVAVENAYMPFNVIDEETGEAVGWDYDTLGLICELVNCQPEFIETSWEGMIVAVSNGEYDMAADGITITEERAQIVDYSVGYIDLSQKFMVRVDEDRFANAEEFVAGDFIIGVQVATTNFEAASGLVSEDRIVAYSEFGFAVQALISGDVDGVVIDDVAGQGYTGLNADKIKLLPDELTKEQLGFIYPQGSDLLEPFNAALEVIMADGRLQAINDKWFGSDEEEDMALPDLGGRTVTVAVENAYMPFNVIDEETGEAVGWDYDTLGLICELVNCQPEFIETSWEGMIVAVSNGEYDMAADGITITEERAQIVDYSVGYIDLSQKFMVRVDEDRFANAEEFVAGDFIIGVQVATTNFEAASGLVSEDRIVAYSEFGFAVQALISGDVDGVVIDDVAGQGYTGLNADKIKLLPDELTKEQLGFIYPQGSDLLEPFNAALEVIMADGRLQAINDKWFGSDEEEDMALPDLGGRTVTVAVENAYMPFNVIDEETGEAVGWDYDTLGLICELVNCQPEFIETSWEGMIVAVSNGEYDMAADGITITEERAQIVDYSVGYIDLSQKFMVRVDEDRFANAEEFVAGDFIIGVQVATTNFEAASGLVSEDRIVAYSEFGFAVQALISGDVDGVVIDDVAGQGYTGLNADKIKLLPDELTKEQLGFIYPQGSDLVEPFNAALEVIMADGRLQAINDKWFGADA